jgi:hypothetical protein
MFVTIPPPWFPSLAAQARLACLREAEASLRRRQAGNDIFGFNFGGSRSDTNRLDC